MLLSVGVTELLPVLNSAGCPVVPAELPSVAVSLNGSLLVPSTLSVVNGEVAGVEVFMESTSFSARVSVVPMSEPVVPSSKSPLDVSVMLAGTGVCADVVSVEGSSVELPSVTLEGSEGVSEASCPSSAEGEVPLLESVPVEPSVVGAVKSPMVVDSE